MEGKLWAFLPRRRREPLNRSRVLGRLNNSPPFDRLPGAQVSGWYFYTQVIGFTLNVDWVGPVGRHSRSSAGGRRCQRGTVVRVSADPRRLQRVGRGQRRAPVRAEPARGGNRLRSAGRQQFTAEIKMSRLLSETMAPSSAAPSTRRWTSSWRRPSTWRGPLETATPASVSPPSIRLIPMRPSPWVLTRCLTRVGDGWMCGLNVACLVFMQAKVNNSSLVGLGYTQTLKPGEPILRLLAARLWLKILNE